ncbi:MAG: hypothetical protein ACO2ZK_11335, partial [Gemmobacter sp.]
MERDRSDRQAAGPALRLVEGGAAVRARAERKTLLCVVALPYCAVADDAAAAQTGSVYDTAGFLQG